MIFSMLSIFGKDANFCVSLVMYVFVFITPPQ